MCEICSLTDLMSRLFLVVYLPPLPRSPLLTRDYGKEYK